MGTIAQVNRVYIFVSIHKWKWKCSHKRLPKLNIVAILTTLQPSLNMRFKKKIRDSAILPTRWDFFQKQINDPAKLGWLDGDFCKIKISNPGQLLGRVKYLRLKTTPDLAPAKTTKIFENIQERHHYNIKDQLTIQEMKTFMFLF